MARPPLEIDADRVLELVRMGVPVVDIAAGFGCHRSVLFSRFGKAIRRAKVLRKLALLEAQWRLVLAGNVRMLIWLGKQELGQSNKGQAATRGVRTWELARSLRRRGG